MSAWPMGEVDRDATLHTNPLFSSKTFTAAALT